MHRKHTAAFVALAAAEEKGAAHPRLCSAAASAANLQQVWNRGMWILSSHETESLYYMFIM